MHTELIKTAFQPKDFPEQEHLEISLVGRSNVGKSSLLNAILQRKSLARTSQTPGRTQSINFYLWKNAEAGLTMVDLPGYGFSKTGKSSRVGWQPLIENYFERGTVGLTLFLIDSRRNLQEEDVSLLKWLQNYSPIWFIQTKTDKAKATELSKQKNTLLKEIPDAKVFAVSAMKKKGIEKLQQSLWSFE